MCSRGRLSYLKPGNDVRRSAKVCEDAVENAKLLAVFSGSMTEGERNYGSLFFFY